MSDNESWDANKFEQAKIWVQTERENNRDWKVLRDNPYSFDKWVKLDSLSEWLKYKHDTAHWPCISAPEWVDLVSRMEQTEKTAIAIGKQDISLPAPGKGNNWKLGGQLWSRYHDFLLKEKHWSFDSLDALKSSTLFILQHLELDTRQNGPKKGLVLGYVQSGKTANMEALMSAAADRGFNFFIILSGIIDNLREQTAGRMEKDLNAGGEADYTWVSETNLGSNSEVKAQDLFAIKAKKKNRYFTVCLKNKQRLQQLISWIHKDQTAHEDMKIMIIDDEADQASISNTVKKQEKEQREIRKGINELIVDLVEDRQYKRRRKEKDFRPDPNGHACCVNYIMYTATPYANFLSEGPEMHSLYPKDFIISLQPSTEYIGPEQICWDFDKDDETPEKPERTGLRIIRKIDKSEAKAVETIQPKSNNKKTKSKGASAPVEVSDEQLLDPDFLPSFKKAVCWFYCCTAMMRIQHETGTPVATSMLIHTSMLKGAHSVFAKLLLRWLDKVGNDNFIEMCKKVYKDETKKLSITKWKEQHPGYGYQHERDGHSESWPAKDAIQDYLKFEKIVPEIKKMLNGKIDEIILNDETKEIEFTPGKCVPYLMVDNSDSTSNFERLRYPEQEISPRPAVIVIGGNTLARGLTIEGLVSTYFCRDANQQDTLMQMGRWFGYRRGYELLPRVWLNESVKEKFHAMSIVEKDLREDLKRFGEQGVSPAEYAPRIMVSAVNRFKLTGQNHMFNAKKASANYYGTAPQICLFDEDEVVQRKNLELTETFLKELTEKYGEATVSSSKKGCIYWDGVDAKTIEEKLLNNFSFCVNETLFCNELFKNWLHDENVKKGKDFDISKWNIIVAGTGEVSKNVQKAKDQKAKDNADRYWTVCDHTTLEKVERSRKQEESKEGRISIGVLAQGPHRLADIPEDLLGDDDQNSPAGRNSIRERAGRSGIPQLIIYRIYNKSKPQSNERGTRSALNSQHDLIGLWFCLPGDKKERTDSGRLTNKKVDEKRETEEKQ